jgi:hypothetical protein
LGCIWPSRPIPRSPAAASGTPRPTKLDAQWIARLTEMGLLRGSFVPPPEIRALRQYTRQLVHLSQDRTRYWQRLEKLLVRHEALLFIGWR